MTRKEQILQAARNYVSGVMLSSPSDVIHFEYGAKWADEHPNLESLWHDASEEPQGEYEFICQDTLGDVWVTNRRACETCWVERAIRECIVRWAYVKDLLPKGGEQ